MVEAVSDTQSWVAVTNAVGSFYRSFWEVRPSVECYEFICSFYITAELLFTGLHSSQDAPHPLSPAWLTERSPKSCPCPRNRVTRSGVLNGRLPPDGPLEKPSPQLPLCGKAPGQKASFYWPGSCSLSGSLGRHWAGAVAEVQLPLRFL